MSDVTAVILGFSINVWAVVKAIKEGEYSNAGEEAEDSDYEIESEHPGGSAPEERGDGEEEKEPGSLPVLTMGSFAWYVWYTMIVMLESLTRLTAGDLCSSICTLA